MEDKLESVQSSEEKYNVVKNELVSLHRKKGGLGANGLDTINDVTRIISWNSHSDHSWIDTVLVAVLPSAYPVLPPSTYKSITEDKLYGPKANASYKALAKYGALMEIGYNWGIGDTIEGMSEYDSIRAAETIYGPGMRSDHRSVRGWRLRLKGLRDANGSTEHIGSGGTSVSLHSQVWLDPTGAFSISYPETADAMASILASMVPAGSSVIDMTACVGGNSSYFSYYFRNVTAIEIAPHRQQILEHNLRLLNPGNEDQVVSISPSALYSIPADKRPKVSIVIGDSQEILTPNPSYKDLARADPLGQVLFLDPPWGGPNYMYLPRPLQLEMVTREGGAVSAAEFLRPVLMRIRQEQQMLPAGRGLLSGVRHIGMKVPDEYDIAGLRKVLSVYNGVATDPFLIPDRTRKNRVFFIVMTLL
jgi:16S rRNA G966 N2-methylase RsmD